MTALGFCIYTLKEQRSGFSLQCLLLLRSTVLLCPAACGIFPTRDQTHVPCIGRWTLNHWTTREAPSPSFLTKKDRYRKNFILSHKITNLSSKVWENKYLGFMGDVLSVVTLPFHCISNHRQDVNKWAGLSSSQTLFMDSAIWISYRFHMSWNIILLLIFFPPST